MGIPNLNVSGTTIVTRDQAINLLLQSIALEEAAIAAILNANAEVIQTNTDAPTAEAIDAALRALFPFILKKEILLQLKAEAVADFDTTPEA